MTLKFKIERDHPVPATSRPGDYSDTTESILALDEEGLSFFVPCTGDERKTIQARIGVAGAQLRKRGRIEFYLITRRVNEIRPLTDDEGNEILDDDGEVIKEPTDGIRVWRRASSIEEV